MPQAAHGRSRWEQVLIEGICLIRGACLLREDEPRELKCHAVFKTLEAKMHCPIIVTQAIIPG